MTGDSPTSRLLEVSPIRDIVLKKLDLKSALDIKGLAKLFDNGGGQGLLDYRASNLLEDNTAARRVFQEALMQMPDELRLLASLLTTAQELHDRAAGRNAEDTKTIISGLRELLAQWTAREAAVKAALAEARQGADDAIVAALDAAACERGHHLAQIAALEAELEAVQHQLRDAERVADARNSEVASAQDAKLQADAAQARLQLGAVKVAFASPKRGAGRPADGQSREDFECAGRIRAVWPRSGSPASHSLQIVGRREVGATLHVVAADGESDSHNSALQWLRQVAGLTELEIIAGAVRSQYSPEPADGGCRLAVRSHGAAGPSQVVASAGPVTLAQELEEEAAALMDREASFNVVVVQFNGGLQRQKVVSVLRVSPSGVALHGVDGSVRCQAAYHDQMQICGARGGGDGAAQGLFLAFQRGDAYMLACESSKQRNVCILLIRKLAATKGFNLQGPVAE